jgi:uncharacterized protein YjbJ (UPF0337 family)
MVKLKNINQKLKGKLQQMKGDIEIAADKPIKGNIDKLKGKVNVVSADIKNNLE